MDSALNTVFASAKKFAFEDSVKILGGSPLFLGGFLLMLVPAVFTFLGETQVDIGLSIGLFEIMLICAPMPVILIGIFCTYQGVVNAMRALADKPVRYALSIPFVR